MDYIVVLRFLVDLSSDLSSCDEDSNDSMTTHIMMKRSKPRSDSLHSSSPSLVSSKSTPEKPKVKRVSLKCLPLFCKNIINQIGICYQNKSSTVQVCTVHTCVSYVCITDDLDFERSVDCSKSFITHEWLQRWFYLSIYSTLLHYDLLSSVTFHERLVELSGLLLFQPLVSVFHLQYQVNI